MKFTLSIILSLSISVIVYGQGFDAEWYSESSNNGIVIQNSYPKGGPYPGPTNKYFNYSYLVFFSRVINETDKPLDFVISFLADSFPIPNSSNTYMKLFLPPDTMTMAKYSLFSYGFKELKSFDFPTRFQRTIQPKAACLFYVVAIFYQTEVDAIDQPRGGNRAELVLNGDRLIYNLKPQVDSLQCGILKIK